MKLDYDPQKSESNKAKHGIDFVEAALVCDDDDFSKEVVTMNNAKTISAEGFDRKFDAGEDVSEYLDFDNAIRPNKPQRLTLDLPCWTVTALDKEAGRIGITRQSLIKTLIDNGLRSVGYSNAP